MADPFQILGLERTFALTAAQVSAAHLRASARLHPDRARDAAEREELLQRAAEAGEAKQRLSSDVSRAEALLALLDAKAALDAPLPGAFLAEAMELRERIEEAAQAGDAEAIGEIRAEVSRAREACVAEIAAAFRGAAAAKEVPVPLAKLRYLERMRARIGEVEA